MGKGRAPCCDKSKVKRGPWSPDEDMKLISFIHNHGHDNWRSLPKQAGLLRCGKSCRLRWINYLRPDLKRGNFTAEEEAMIIKLHQSFGNKWSKIASLLPGRTDNEIKNVWHTHLKKRLIQNSATDLNSDLSRSSPGSSDLVKDQEESLTKKTSQESSLHELSSPSMSSGSSNFINQEDDLIMSQLLSNIEAYGEITNMFQEVDKPELLEIPFDSDPNIWNMFDDDLDTSRSSASQENSLATRAEESDEDEVKKWFKYLERELLIEEDDNQLSKQDVDEEDSSSLMKSYALIIR